jgi:hypothetical protein
VISFQIVEKFVPKEELVKVAKAILSCQDIKELSWDKDKSEYEKSMFQSSREAVEYIGLDKFWIPIIHHWNTFMWNDVQAFAQDIIEDLKEMEVK